MQRSRTLMAGVAATAMLVTATACSNSGTAQETSSPSAAASSSAPATEDGNAADHNAADVKFVHHMIPHHQQAIEMSDMILAKTGIDPQVSELATQIKAAQGPEIKQLQGWLTQWGMPTMAMTPGMEMPGMEMPGMDGAGSEAPTTPGTSTMPRESMMPDMDAMPPMQPMAGMMSPADMDALNNAQGIAASKLFLTQMITHHQGAITMSDKEIKQGRFPAAISMAESIVASQQKEIDTMNQILSELGGP